MPTSTERAELTAAADELEATYGLPPELVTDIVRQVFNDHPGTPDEVVAALRSAAEEN